MSLWALVSLLTRRFSPRALPAGRGYGGVMAAAAVAGGGASAIQYFKKYSSAGNVIGEEEEAEKEGTNNDKRQPLSDPKVIGEEAGHEFEKQDMKARFEDWVRKNNKTYKDEEEKAMRFQVFMDTVKWIESQPPSSQENMLPEISYFADFTEDECPWNRSCVDLNNAENEEFCKHIKFLAKSDKAGELLIWRVPVKQTPTDPGN